MKRAWLLIGFVTFSLVGQAQNRAIDSLKTLISEEKNDIERIDLENKLISNLIEFNLDSAIALGNKVVVEAERIGYPKG